MTQPRSSIELFLREALGEPPQAVTRVAGDASFRGY